MESSEIVTFTPTLEEFKDFPRYIKYLESVGAHHAGVVKVIPPAEWIPRAEGYEQVNSYNYTIKKPLVQNFKKGTISGAYQINGSVKNQTTVQEYRIMAKNKQYQTPDHLTYKDLEKKYWKSISDTSAPPPIYGCDVDESIFDQDQKYWNLRNLQTIMNTINTTYDLRGVNKPYVYFGMWKSTFAWHVEDMDLYSVNYLHYGMPKTWYVVPPKYGHLLEKTARELFPNVASWCSNFMRHKTCLISPKILEKFGIPYKKVIQEERNAIIVFPYAFHSGFNHGFNIAEAVNFASKRWIEYGKRARQCDCQSSRVVFSMDAFIKKYQPNQYRLWRKGIDIGPHPEDPPDIKSEFELRANNPKAFIEMKRKQMIELNERIKSIRENEVTLYDKMRSKEQPFHMNSNSTIKIYHIYQHHEYFNMKIAIDPETMHIHPQGKELLWRMINFDNPEIVSLIDEGVFIKVGEQTMIIKEEDGWIWELEFFEKLVHVYCHNNKNLEAFVDPESLELFGDQMPELFEFLQDVDIKEYIARGIFSYKRDDSRGCLKKS